MTCSNELSVTCKTVPLNHSERKVNKTSYQVAGGSYMWEKKMRDYDLLLYQYVTTVQQVSSLFFDSAIIVCF